MHGSLPRPRRGHRPSVVFLALSLAAMPALAGTPGVFHDQITVTATGVETGADEVPVAVTVIDREAIDAAGAEAVTDLLRRVPGLHVARAGDEGKQVSLFVRGTESDHTLIQLDGVRLNSPYFGGFDLGLLPTAGLERIEVVRGPASALYGADAIGGVVNLVPAVAGDGLNGAILAETGGQGWRRSETAVSWRGGPFNLLATYSDRGGDGALPNADFEARQTLVDGGLSWGRGHRLAVVAQWLESDTGIPFSSPGSPSPLRRQSAEQRLLAVPLTIEVADAWTVRVAASRVERELDFSDPDDAFGYTSSATAADTTEGRASVIWNTARHRLTTGAEWRRDEVEDASSYGVNLQGEAVTSTGAFVQDEWRPSRALHIVAGVRRDHTESWGDHWSPRLSVGLALGDRSEVRAGYGRAFRQPSVGELYFPFSGNPALEPERSRSAEVGFVHRPGERSRLELTAFATDLDDLVDFDYTTYRFMNVASATIRGVEGAWTAPLGESAASLLQATWLDTEDASGMELLRRPTWRASWTAYGNLGARVSGDIAVLWVGARDDVDPVTYGRTHLDDHVTASLAVAVEVWRGVDLTLRVANLTDARYEEIAGYPAPSRRIMAGLRVGL